MGKFYEFLSMLSSYIHIKETWGVYAQKSLMFLILLMEKGQEVKKHSILVEVRSFRVPETFLMCIHKLSVKQQQCRIFSLPQQETSQSLLFFREFKPANWSLPWKHYPFVKSYFLDRGDHDSGDKKLAPPTGWSHD